MYKKIQKIKAKRLRGTKKNTISCFSLLKAIAKSKVKVMTIALKSDIEREIKKRGKENKTKKKQ